MRAEWTPAVVRAVDAAHAWAMRLGAPAPAAAHLLLGLLDEEEGRAAESLGRAGITVEAARDCLRASHATDGTASWESSFSTALALAIERTGEPFVRTDHVLIAVLRHAPDLLSQLQAAGLSMSALDGDDQAQATRVLQLDEPLDLSGGHETLDVVRIIDAAANRAREALRVIEDYCRFALNDAFLCREVKTLRHDLAAALETVGRAPLLQARDTPGDVGTGIATARESKRDSLLHIAQVNLKRLQESLRSLEEYGKLFRPELGSALERLRYRAYTLERAIVLGTGARERLANARLYLLVTGSQCATSLEFLIAEAAAGGVDIVQLREKELTDRDLLDRARKVRHWTKKAGVLFIVNDRPDIARLAGADGVHLGQGDMPVREARRILGADALIGVSTHNLAQVRHAIRDGADYIGIGPVFPSATKTFDQFPGLDFVREALRETSLPAFALGGLTVENLAQLVAAGATRIAVSAAICGADEPQPAAQALSAMLEENTHDEDTQETQMCTEDNGD